MTHQGPLTCNVQDLWNLLDFYKVLGMECLMSNKNTMFLARNTLHLATLHFGTIDHLGLKGLLLLPRMHHSSFLLRS